MLDRFKGWLLAIATLAGYGEPEAGGRWSIRWQNLSKEDGEGDAPLHGRAWLHWTPDHDEALRLSWNLRSSFAHASVSSDRSDGCEIGLSIALPPVALWLTLDSRSLLGDLLERLGDREIRVAFHDRTLWWNLGLDPDEWRSNEPRWRRGSFDVAEALFGKESVTETPVGDPEPVAIPMPEGAYAGMCSMLLVRRARPRWISSSFRVAEIELSTPIPVPGKGENSWDCDEDAIHSLRGPAITPADAVANLVRSALSTRERRGGRDWRPSKPAPRPIAEA